MKLHDRPDWADYRLTAKGLDFFPVIGLAVEWAEDWYLSDEGPVLAWQHKVCGNEFTGILVCDQCDQSLAGADVDLQPED